MLGSVPAVPSVPSWHSRRHQSILAKTSSAGAVVPLSLVVRARPGRRMQPPLSLRPATPAVPQSRSAAVFSSPSAGIRTRSTVVDPEERTDYNEMSYMLGSVVTDSEAALSPSLDNSQRQRVGSSSTIHRGGGTGTRA